jgi:tetratricopeptide (TPR) repeat protein
MSRRTLELLAIAAALSVSIAFVRHLQTNAEAAEVKRSAPLVAFSTASFNEAEVRDRDIEFYSRRLDEDSSSAADRAMLAGLYFARSRTTGSFEDLKHSEALALGAIETRTQRNYQAFELLASVLMAQHEFRKARTIALTLDSLDPGTASHLALLGEVELELGMYDQARAHFDSVHYDGRNFTTGARLARWYEVTGHLGKARTFLKQSIARVDQRDDLPRDQVAWFHYRLGDLELRAGRVAAADSAMRAGLAIDPEDSRVLGGLARVAFERREWQRAVDFGERAAAVLLDPATLGVVSRAYAELGDTAQAASYAHAMSISALKQSGAIHRAWGLFLLDYGTSTERAQVLKRARLELRDRRDVYGHDLLAWALYRNGRVQEARVEMRLALAQNTEDVMLAKHAQVMGLK